VQSTFFIICSKTYGRADVRPWKNCPTALSTVAAAANVQRKQKKQQNLTYCQSDKCRNAQTTVNPEERDAAVSHSSIACPLQTGRRHPAAAQLTSEFWQPTRIWPACSVNISGEAWDETVIFLPPVWRKLLLTERERERALKRVCVRRRFHYEHRLCARERAGCARAWAAVKLPCNEADLNTTCRQIRATDWLGLVVRVPLTVCI